MDTSPGYSNGLDWKAIIKPLNNANKIGNHNFFNPIVSTFSSLIKLKVIPIKINTIINCVVKIPDDSAKGIKDKAENNKIKNKQHMIFEILALKNIIENTCNKNKQI